MGTRRSVAFTLAIAAVAVAALAIGSQDDGSRATRALAMTTAAATSAPVSRDLEREPVAGPAVPPAVPALVSTAPSPAESARTTFPVIETPAPSPAPVGRVAAPASLATPTPMSAPPATPVATFTPVVCPSDWFCYPRVGIAGPIVPYADCSGQTNVGTQIRSFSCISDRYLMAHAYTSFGRIADWQAGDVVIARGVTYRVRGAFPQPGCTQPVLPLAPLTMQTSLTSSACGPVLIVQAE